MHRLIFLWCHPRSLSSALERAMLERGDMATLHEPFLYLYYVHEGRKCLPHLEVDPRRPTSYEAIRSMILETARTRPVFVKDMCYYVHDRIRDDVDFIRRMTSTFLIRDPARTIPSYFRLDPGVTLEEIGCEAQYRHFERVGEITGRTPIVIDAADLAGDPAGALRAYCQALEVPFLPHALEWDEGLPAAWREVGGWHADLAVSRGLIAKPGRPTAGSGSGGSGDSGSGGPGPNPVPGPGAGPGPDAAPHLRDYYEHHFPFYRKMRAHRLEPATG